MELTTTSAPPRRRLRWVADTLLLGTAAIWGATFFMVKEATSEFPVLAFLVVRFTIASAALLPFALIPMIRHRRWPTWQAYRWGIGAGMLFCGGYIFQTFALRLIDSGRVGFITGLYVVLVPILALFLLRYPLSARIMTGTGLALVGMILLGYAPGSDLLGDILSLLCALSFAGQILVVDRMPANADWRFLALVQSVVVAAICGALLPLLAATRACDTTLCAALSTFADPIPVAIPPLIWAVAAYTGLLATAAALVIQVWAQRIIPPSDAALIYAMEAPFSVVFGVIFLGELVTTLALIGSALIFAGMVITSLTGSEAKHTKPGGPEVRPAEASAAD